MAHDRPADADNPDTPDADADAAGAGAPPPLPECIAVAAFGQRLTLHAPPYPFLREDTLWRLREIYEPALCAQAPGPAGVAVDIGAGFGGFALPFAAAFPGWRVWCFEPEPAAFAMLARNLADLALPNVTALNLAVGEGPDDAAIAAALLAAGRGGAAELAALRALCPPREFRGHRDLRGVIERGQAGGDVFDAMSLPTLPAAALASLAPTLLKLLAPHAEAAILEGLAKAPLDHIMGETWTLPPSRHVHGRTPGRRETWLPVAGVPPLKLRRAHDPSGRCPGLDIVVAMYNAEDWIVPCIEGLLASPSDEIGIIVVDDGSTDGSADLVRAGYGRHPRVRMQRKANGGCATARNHGRRASTASHIAFVDSDDVAGPGLFSELLELARYTGAEVVQAGFQLMHPDGAGGWRSEPSYEARDAAFAGPRRHAFGSGSFATLPAALLMTGQPSIWRRVYRRDFLDSRRIWFPEHIRAFDDQLFQLLTLQAARSVPALDHVHYHYRQHPGQDIRQGDERAFYSLEMFRLMLRQALAEGWNDLGPALASYAHTINWCWSTLRPDLRPAFVRAAAELWVWMQKALPPAAFADLPDGAIRLPDFGHYSGRLHRLLADLGPSHGWAYLDAADMHVPMLRAAGRPTGKGPP